MSDFDKDDAVTHRVSMALAKDILNAANVQYRQECIDDVLSYVVHGGRARVEVAGESQSPVTFREPSAVYLNGEGMTTDWGRYPPTHAAEGGGSPFVPFPLGSTFPFVHSHEGQIVQDPDFKIVTGFVQPRHGQGPISYRLHTPHGGSEAITASIEELLIGRARGVLSVLNRGSVKRTPCYLEPNVIAAVSPVVLKDGCVRFSRGECVAIVDGAYLIRDVEGGLHKTDTILKFQWPDACHALVVDVDQTVSYL